MLESTGGAAATAIHCLCAVAPAWAAHSQTTRRAKTGEDSEQIIDVDSPVVVDVGAARTGTTEV